MTAKGNASTRLSWLAVLKVFISFAVTAALAVLMFFFKIPNPNIVLMTALAVFTSLYGYAAGVASEAVLIIYSMYFFSENHSFLSYTGVNVQKITVIIVGSIVCLFFIGNLQRIKQKTAKKLRLMNEALRRDNEMLETASTTDTLTGIQNRFALHRKFDGYIGKDISLIMLDVDDFKYLNDNYDHILGDLVLKNLGESLISIFGSENCYRYGGDEFLIIFEGSSESEITDRLNVLINENRGVEYEGKHADVHFSAGYVIGHVNDQADLRLMLKAADANLYSSKNTGKNKYTGSIFKKTE